MDSSEPRPWQADVIRETIERPDNKILWVWDKTGKGAGKTELAKRLHSKRNIFVTVTCSDTAIRELLFKIKKIGETKVSVIVSLNQKFERRHYVALEHLHDGMIDLFYRSKEVLILGRTREELGMVVASKEIKVIVLSNYEPNTKYLKEHKLKLRVIEDPEGPLCEKK